MPLPTFLMFDHVCSNKAHGLSSLSLSLIQTTVIIQYYAMPEEATRVKRQRAVPEWERESKIERAATEKPAECKLRWASYVIKHVWLAACVPVVAVVTIT